MFDLSAGEEEEVAAAAAAAAAVEVAAEADVSCSIAVELISPWALHKCLCKESLT